MIPRIARGLGLEVPIGADAGSNARQIDTLARLVAADDSVAGVIARR